MPKKVVKKAIPKKEKLEVVLKELPSKEHANFTYKTFEGVKKNKTHFTEAQIKEYVDTLVNDKGIDIRDIAISGMGITNDFTLKYFDNNTFYNTNDYYRDKVEDATKFDDYQYINVTIRKDK